MYIYVYTNALTTSQIFAAVVVSVQCVNTKEWNKKGAEGRRGVMKGSARMRKTKGYGSKWERQREKDGKVRGGKERE